MDTPSSIPPQKLAEMIEAMQMARDELIKASLLLRDHLDETDEAGREQARRIAEALIAQSRNN
ncbi:hypothetical protein [Rhodoferax sp. BAB1]|uniref:hypothetical protein n=1 Tax=Rhodoferax sp. BAB1 TaxID=2741720 RepID=UPI001575E577|nr:hypothetical protein [Rhodoferax sp. BAB1]QKO22061.1 hypothetical protein HTY51_09230 [Rhodoferax sp. BAB1]